MKHLLAGIFLFFILVNLNAQDYKLSGKIDDAVKQRPAAGVTIVLTGVKDSTDKHMTSTNDLGSFSFSGLKKQAYKLVAIRVGYESIVQTVEITSPFQLIGPLSMERKVEQLKDVVIEGQQTPVVQKGDTTEMSASAYKVNPDANAQDLVQKMPGVTVENGTIKAHGETVQRILVDGKNYFGEDASMALQNLPAEVIDKVQIYNKMSDQAEFTGFDDGNSSKVLNIVTRTDRRNGSNGQFVAGTDFDNKYMGAGRLNISKGDKRISFTGGLNNVNQQAFSTQDLISGSRNGGGGGRSGGAASYTGRQSGINTNRAIGINFTNTFSPKLTLTGSYFFNNQDNKTAQLSNNQYVGIDTALSKIKPQSAAFSKTNNNSTSQNYNHRFDFKLEYQLDSANSIIWAPRFSTQQNNRDGNNTAINFNHLSSPLLNSATISSTNSLGVSYSNDLTFRHKFATKGRTISLGIGVNGNVRNSDGTNQYNDTIVRRYTGTDTMATTLRDQDIHSKSHGYSISPNLSYTEPIGNISIVQLSYNYTLNNNSSQRYIENNGTTASSPQDSNVYKNSYNTHRAGITYRIRPIPTMMVAAGIDYQYADLNGDRTNPIDTTVNKQFDNFLPNAMLDYKISQRSNVRMQYRTSTNAPSIDQLQDVLIGTNSSYNIGNPKLEPQYVHNAFLNYRFSDPAKFVNFSFNLYGIYTLHSIGNATTTIQGDTTIQGQTLHNGYQLVKPVNMDDAAVSLSVFSNYGFLFEPIKCNFTFRAGGGYSQTPGYVNHLLSTSKSTNLFSGVVIASNISQNVDFTGSYITTYTVSKNNIQSNLNSNTWNHNISLKSNFIWNGFVLTNSLTEQINRGLTGGYNQDFLQWNVGLGKKILANKSLEAKISIFDVLNSNTNISRTVSELAITDTQTNTLQRFYLFTLTYTLRAYKSENRGDRFRDGFRGGDGQRGGDGPRGGGF
jgi:hypothetical protein